MFSHLIIDFPAVLAVDIFFLFAAVVIISLFRDVKLDDGLRQAMIAVMMLMVGFYFGQQQKPPPPPGASSSIAPTSFSQRFAGEP